jgi:hypothetical protein
MTPHPAADTPSAQPQTGARASLPQSPVNAGAERAPARQLYLALSDASRRDHAAIDAAADWLAAQLQAANGRGEAAVLPSEGDAFAAWLSERQDDIDERYKQYVAERRAGQPRRLFASRAHALYYLTAIAPARLTDGAWLYGVLARWDDAALRPLITTYLEELGNGVPDKNHVVIFQQLIDAHGCANWQRLGERHFHDGLIQLALAHHAERFLPELVGYNLGIENADLDTLVAAYEMNELGIDPYYFSLHATADNSATGHARLAQQALRQLIESGSGDQADLLQRVDGGFRLHGRRPRSSELLAGFDVHGELHKALAAKHLPASGDGMTHPAAQLVIDGRPLDQWLAAGEPAALLDALLRDGWLVRGSALDASRLWRMIEAPQDATGDEETPAPPLAGVFTPYELALLAEWTAGGSDASGSVGSSANVRRLHATNGSAPLPERVRESAERGIIRHRFPDDEHGWEAIANELTLLEARVVASSSKEEAIALLASLMAPTNHHTSTGLMATRMFSKLFAA